MSDLLFLFHLAPYAARLAGRAGALLGARSLLALLEPIALMATVNAIAAGHDVRVVVGAGAALTLIKLGHAGIGITARERLSYASQRFTLSLRDRLYRHVQRLPPPALVRGGRARQLWLLTGDLTSLETVFSDVLVRLVGLAIGIVGAVVALMLLEPRLSLLAIIVTTVVSIAIARRHTDMTELAAAARDARATLTQEMEERLSAMEAIQLAGRQRIEVARLRSAGVDVARAELRSVRMQARVWGRAELLSGGIQAGVVLVGGYIATAGTLSVGALLAAYLYIGQLLQTAGVGAQMLGRLQAALVAAGRVRAVFAERPAVVGGPLRPAVAGPATLSVENVRFAYNGGAPVLDGLTFTLRCREHVALVGRTGSGKTTFVRLAARFADPSAGRICLDGHDLRDLDIAALRRSVIVLPQTAVLLRGTLADNICFSPESRGASARAAAQRAGLDEYLCATVGTRVVGDGGATLSGGECQRVALARLFVEKPRLLVLDEPTRALDSKTADAVWASIRSHAQDCTMLVITHDLRLASRFPRVLLLDNGRIVADGPGSTVLPHMTTTDDHLATLTDCTDTGVSPCASAY